MPIMEWMEWEEYFKDAFEKEHQGDDCPWKDEQGKEAYFTHLVEERKYKEKLKKRQKDDDNGIIAEFPVNDGKDAAEDGEIMDQQEDPDSETHGYIKKT